MENRATQPAEIAFPGSADSLARMKLVRWALFTWDLSKIDGGAPSLEPRYAIRTATKAEEKDVRNVIMAAFALDSDWSDVLLQLRDRFDEALDEVFRTKGPIPCLVLTTGQRIIGASALSLDPAAQNHLVSGPCILNEYRNRGCGAALLKLSLLALRDAGLTTAHGVTKQSSPAAKFVYSKHGSVSTRCEFEPELALT